MECLLHADEHHFVQNEEVYCPVCILSNTLFTPSNNSVAVVFNTEDFVEEFDEIHFEKELVQFKTSRAPPQLV